MTEASVGTDVVRRVTMAVGGAQGKKNLGRKLTDEERLVLGIIAARPTNAITLTSLAMSSEECHRAFRNWKRRVERAKNAKGPLVYFAAPARKAGTDRYHIHLLTWEYLPDWIARRHALEVGFGYPELSPIPPPDDSLKDAASMIGYVIAQKHPVFGKVKHLTNDPREKYKRPFWSPQPRTLGIYAPALLSAIDHAKDRSWTDEAIANSIPSLNRG